VVFRQYVFQRRVVVGDLLNAGGIADAVPAMLVHLRVRGLIIGIDRRLRDHGIIRQDNRKLIFRIEAGNQLRLNDAGVVELLVTVVIGRAASISRSVVSGMNAAPIQSRIRPESTFSGTWWRAGHTVIWPARSFALLSGF